MDVHLYFFIKIPYTSDMSENNNDKERSFIKEKIVPRNNVKRILKNVLGALGLGVLFGIGAALAFFASQDLLEGRTETQPSQQIIIIRDDTTEASQDSAAAESRAPAQTSETAGRQGDEESRPSQSETKDTDRGTADASASATEDSTEGSTEPASGEEAASTSGAEYSSDQESPAMETETSQEEQDPDPQDVYKKIMNGIVNIRITRNQGTDWFDDERFSQTEAFGAIIGETDQDFFVLTDSMNIREGDKLSVAMNGYVIYGTVQGRDDRTHLCVVRFPKSPDPGDAAVIPLGNSFQLKSLTQIYMTGAPHKIPGETVRGMITNIVDDIPETDGYKQLIYTDMTRISGGSAILFTEEGKIVGWVSDYTNVEGTNQAAACGISPLKYLIEDAMSGTETAYLGIRCTQVTAYDAVVNGMEEGFYISSVEENSPAFTAGLQTGDRLISINDQRVSGSHVLQIRIDQDLSPGQEIDVVVERRSAAGYEPLTIRVTAGSR